MEKRKTINTGKIFAISIIGILLFAAAPTVSACVDTELLAGQNENAGNVHVWRHDTTLYVEYTTTGGWEITEAHLAVAKTFQDIPQTKKGNPKVGKFPYKADFPGGTTQKTFEIDLTNYYPANELSGKTFYLAAHAVVFHPEYGEETAWADTIAEEFPGGSWALYFTVTLG